MDASPKRGKPPPPEGNMIEETERGTISTRQAQRFELAVQHNSHVPVLANCLNIVIVCSIRTNEQKHCLV